MIVSREFEWGDKYYVRKQSMVHASELGVTNQKLAKTSPVVSAISCNRDAREGIRPGRSDGSGSGRFVKFRVSDDDVTCGINGACTLHR